MTTAPRSLTWILLLAVFASGTWLALHAADPRHSVTLPLLSCVASIFLTILSYEADTLHHCLRELESREFHTYATVHDVYNAQSTSSRIGSQPVTASPDSEIITCIFCGRKDREDAGWCSFIDHPTAHWCIRCNNTILRNWYHGHVAPSVPNSVSSVNSVVDSNPSTGALPA